MESGFVSNRASRLAGMDQSTGAPLGVAVAMKSVEDGVGVLAGSLAGGAVRDLSHDELTGLVAAGRRAQARIGAAVLAAVGEVDARRSHLHTHPDAPDHPPADHPPADHPPADHHRDAHDQSSPWQPAAPRPVAGSCGSSGYASKCLHCPSDTTSTVPSTTVMAVCSSMA